MTTHRGVRRLLSAAAWVVAVLAVPAFVLTSCPSNRDGVPGQLAAAKDKTLSAARSGALALQMWSARRSTSTLACVQLSDARDEVVKAYRGTAVLTARAPVDVDRQRLLTGAMTTIVDTLNQANAVVRGVPGPGDASALRQRLLAGADALDRDYR